MSTILKGSKGLFGETFDSGFSKNFIEVDCKEWSCENVIQWICTIFPYNNHELKTKIVRAFEETKMDGYVLFHMGDDKTLLSFSLKNILGKVLSSSDKGDELLKFLTFQTLQVINSKTGRFEMDFLTNSDDDL